MKVYIPSNFLHGTREKMIFYFKNPEIVQKHTHTHTKKKDHQNQHDLIQLFKNPEIYQKHTNKNNKEEIRKKI